MRWNYGIAAAFAAGMLVAACGSSEQAHQGPSAKTDNAQAVGAELSAGKATGKVAAVAAAHPNGKYVSYAEFRELQAAGKINNANGVKSQDFNDCQNVPTGIENNGSICECQDLCDCETMFYYYCNPYDTSADGCYTYYDSYGNLWGTCQCICD